MAAMWSGGVKSLPQLFLDLDRLWFAFWCDDLDLHSVMAQMESCDKRTGGYPNTTWGSLGWIVSKIDTLGETVNCRCQRHALTEEARTCEA